MRKIVAVENVSLDGVMQAPGGPDEDTRGGFTLGGWAASYHDDVMMREMSRGFGQDLLFGRRTYEQFYEFWPKQEGNPFTEVLNNAAKYVVSNSLHAELPWVNSTLLSGDIATAVATLRNQPGSDLTIIGSGELVRCLTEHALIDEYQLLIHPVLLNSGRRLFPDTGSFAELELVNSVTTTTGVIIATYRPRD
ncbi:MAG: dihydrofolate reductase [Actinophytocola sp.]|nr:dihydrofolate reductase [Actinophytocola sp.]